MKYSYTSQNPDNASQFGREYDATQLTKEAFEWLNHRLELAFAKHGKLTPAELETLDWPAVATVPGKQDLILTDLDANNVRVNLRTRANYIIPAGHAGVTRHFRVEVQPAPGGISFPERSTC